jgi:ribonuclease HI
MAVHKYGPCPVHRMTFRHVKGRAMAPNFTDMGAGTGAGAIAVSGAGAGADPSVSYINDDECAVIGNSDRDTVGKSRSDNDKVRGGGATPADSVSVDVSVSSSSSNQGVSGSSKQNSNSNSNSGSNSGGGSGRNDNDGNSLSRVTALKRCNNEDSYISNKINLNSIKFTGDPLFTEDDDRLICFTDGACENNGKENAAASYSVVWPEHPDMDEAHALGGGIQTNNRGEYQALIHALKQADRLDPERRKVLTVFTDSRLLRQSVVEWMPSWKQKGWRKADGASVKNIDLLKQIDSYMQKRKLDLHHVKAHTGGSDWASVYNDKADRLAVGVLRRDPQ